MPTMKEMQADLMALSTEQAPHIIIVISVNPSGATCVAKSEPGDKARNSVGSVNRKFPNAPKN